MKIETHYDMETPSLEGPYDNYGMFVVSGTDAKEHNFVALFAERSWHGYGKGDCAVSFKPMPDKEAFWVNAKTKDLVRTTIDDAIQALQSTFEKSGLQEIAITNVS